MSDSCVFHVLLCSALNPTEKKGFVAWFVWLRPIPAQKIILGRLRTVYYTTPSPFFRPAWLLLRWIDGENLMWHIRELRPADSTPHLNRYMMFAKEEHWRPFWRKQWRHERLQALMMFQSDGNARQALSIAISEGVEQNTRWDFDFWFATNSQALKWCLYSPKTSNLTSGKQGELVRDVSKAVVMFGGRAIMGRQSSNCTRQGDGSATNFVWSFVLSLSREKLVRTKDRINS
jgi:hypothetical protein